MLVTRTLEPREALTTCSSPRKIPFWAVCSLYLERTKTRTLQIIFLVWILGNRGGGRTHFCQRFKCQGMTSVVPQVIQLDSGFKNY